MITPDSIKVLLIGNYSPDEQYSMQRFYAEIAESLKESGIDLTCIAPRSTLLRLIKRRSICKRWAGYLDKYLVFRVTAFLHMRKYDIVHIVDHSNAIYVGWFKSESTIVTCHDLFAVRLAIDGVEGRKTRLMGRLLQRAVLKGLRRCEAIVCVSEATRDDLSKIVAGPAITVIPNAVRPSLRRMEDGEANSLLHAIGCCSAQPFFLHVGGNQFYKNRPGVVRVFDQLAARPPFRTHRLVLAGKAPDGTLLRAVESAAHSDRIVIVENANDVTIQALYSKATALLFLSLLEGFGWPILEAQACQCLVVTSDRAPMSDIVADGGVIVDPTDPIDAADAIERAILNADLYRTAGLRNVERYKPDQIYGRYVDLYSRQMRPPFSPSR